MRVLYLVVCLVLAVVSPRSVGLAADCAVAAGFQPLVDLIPEEVGACLEEPRPFGDFGDVRQRTTARHGQGGMLEWRQPEKVAAFTDGHRTWLLGPEGLQTRLNDESFPWEILLGPPPAALTGPTGDVGLVLSSTTWHARGRWSLGHGLFGPAVLRAAGVAPPTEVPPGAALRFRFARYPDGLRIARWTSDAAKSPIELSPDGSLVLPAAPDVYVYEVVASWERDAFGGQATYMFHVRVVQSASGARVAEAPRRGT